MVVFTDFADTTSAELMLENVGRLLRSHLVLFVVFRDEELEAIATREPPTSADDVSRAVIAAALLRERELVIDPAAPPGRADRRRARRPPRPGAAQPPISTSSAGTCCDGARMAELRLKSHRFRAERESRLAPAGSACCAKAEGRSAARAFGRRAAGGAGALPRHPVVAVGGARDLARPSLIAYLESLCTRAYFFVYGARPSALERLSRLLRPRLAGGGAKACWRETLVCAAMTVLGAVAGLRPGHARPRLVSAPSCRNGLAERPRSDRLHRPSCAHALRRAAKHDQLLSVFATFLFTHNAQIAIFAFALGFAFCLPTALLIAENGCMLGAFLALFVQHGLGFEVGGWLMIHGVTELFAIILAGAAGFRIGWPWPSRASGPGSTRRAEAGRGAGAC